MKPLREYITESKREHSVDQLMGSNTVRQMKGINAVSLWLTHADKSDIEYVWANNNISYLFLKKNGEWIKYDHGDPEVIQSYIRSNRPKNLICYYLDLGTSRTKPSRKELDRIFKSNVFHTLYINIEEPRKITKYRIWYHPLADEYTYSEVDV